MSKIGFPVRVLDEVVIQERGGLGCAEDVRKEEVADTVQGTV